MSVRSLPITHDKENAWKNKVASSINSSNIIGGNGISVGYSPYGTTIKLDGVDDNLPLVWAGDFDINQEYFPNQIVRVNPNTQYYIYDPSDTIPIGSTDTSGFDICPISPGLYVCNAYIPAGACDQYWFDTYIAPQYVAGAAPFDVINGVRWYDYNIYYPIFPEIPSQYTASVVAEGSYGIVANQTFWKAMPCGMVATKFCVNGVNKNVYVLGFMSGSVFQEEYLPYNP